MRQSVKHRRRKIAYTDILMSFLVWAAAIAVTAVFIWLLMDLFWHGTGKLSWEFLTTEPQDAGREGGIASILVSTM
ncbi:MAG: phosphate ABC transporter, permease protein PstA, partial [Cyanobacteria bacterium J06635_10]